MTKLVVMQMEEFEFLANRIIEDKFQKYWPSINKIGVRPEEPFLTRKQMAAELNVSLVTLNTWQNTGLPNHRLHRRIYFIKSEVLEYMQSNIKRHKKG
jgi:hypothetical protein